MHRPLVLTHASFDTNTGLFRLKKEARETADTLQHYLSKAFKDFPANSVVVEGKGHYNIAFPRIRHHWWPRNRTSTALVGELAAIALEYSNIYEEGNSNDDE